MSQRQAAKALGVSHTQVAKDLASGNKVAKDGNKRTTKSERRAERELELAPIFYKSGRP